MTIKSAKMANRERLKPLKWVKQFVETYTCTTPWSHYIISRYGNYFRAEIFYLPGMQRQIFTFDTSDDCMLFCQSDYASQVNNLFEQ